LSDSSLRALVLGRRFNLSRIEHNGVILAALAVGGCTIVPVLLWRKASESLRKNR